VQGSFGSGSAALCIESWTRDDSGQSEDRVGWIKVECAECAQEVSARLAAASRGHTSQCGPAIERPGRSAIPRFVQVVEQAADEAIHMLGGSLVGEGLEALERAEDGQADSWWTTVARQRPTGRNRVVARQIVCDSGGTTLPSLPPVSPSSSSFQTPVSTSSYSKSICKLGRMPAVRVSGM
jgi:hypothetical protein